MHQKARTQKLLGRRETQHIRRSSIIGRAIARLTMPGSTINEKSTDWTDGLFTTLERVHGAVSLEPLAVCSRNRSAGPLDNDGEGDKRCGRQQLERKTSAPSGKFLCCTFRQDPPKPTKKCYNPSSQPPTLRRNWQVSRVHHLARMSRGTFVGTAAPDAACPGRVKELLRRASPSRPAWILWISRERHGIRARKRLDHGARGVKTRHGRTQRSSPDDSGSSARSGDSLS